MNYTIITGASRGIGKAAAIAFAKKGHNLILICHHNTAELQQVAELCMSYSVMCLCFTGDVGNHDFCRSIYETIKKESLTIDILVNNAGISHVGLLQDMTIDEWNKLINTNLTSVFSMTSLAIPHFLQNGYGKIINISSVWGNVGASCETAYSATKGAINSFTKALGKELAPSNIQVNAIAFGAIDTDMNKCFSSEDMAALCEDIPVGRLAAPEEAADAIISLAQMGPYYTGQILTFDGGWI